MRRRGFDPDRPRGFGMDPRWLEACSGSAATLWGLWIELTPGSLTENRTYLALGLFIPKLPLGGLFLAGGLLQLAGVLLDHRLARVPLAAFMASSWLLVAYGIAVSAPTSPTFPLLMALGTWNGLAMVALICLTLQARR